MRSAFEIAKLKGQKSSDVKERVLELVTSKLMPNMEWETKLTEGLRASSYDVADAVLTGLYAVHEYREVEAVEVPEHFSAFKEKEENRTPCLQAICV